MDNNHCVAGTLAHVYRYMLPPSRRHYALHVAAADRCTVTRGGGGSASQSARFVLKTVVLFVVDVEDGTMVIVMRLMFMYTYH